MPESRPQAVTRIAFVLLFTGVLGLLPILMAIQGLASSFAAHTPNPQAWQWKVPPEELYTTLRTALIAFCIAWSGWIVAAIGIYVGTWWGWVWAMALTASVFPISVHFTWSYAASTWHETLLFGVVLMSTFLHALTRPAIRAHCGIAATLCRREQIGVFLGAASYVALYWIGNEMLRVLR